MKREERSLQSWFILEMISWPATYYLRLSQEARPCLLYKTRKLVVS